MVMEQLKDAWWEAVIDSMEEFHGFSLTEAAALAFDLRSDIEGLPDRCFEPDIIYHDEPFHVAADLAGRHIDVGAHQAAYRAILDRRFGHVGNQVAGASETSVGAPGGARGVW